MVKPVSLTPAKPIDIYGLSNRKLSPDEQRKSRNVDEEYDEFVPVSTYRPVGLDLDDFLPVINCLRCFSFSNN